MLAWHDMGIWLGQLELGAHHLELLEKFSAFFCSAHRYVKHIYVQYVVRFRDTVLNR